MCFFGKLFVITFSFFSACESDTWHIGNYGEGKSVVSPLPTLECWCIFHHHLNTHRHGRARLTVMSVKFLVHFFHLVLWFQTFLGPNTQCPSIFVTAPPIDSVVQSKQLKYLTSKTLFVISKESPHEICTSLGHCTSSSPGDQVGYHTFISCSVLIFTQNWHFN